MNRINKEYEKVLNNCVRSQYWKVAARIVSFQIEMT